MKIISFFLGALFICCFENIKASSSLEHSGIYFLEAVEISENKFVGRILDRNEQKNLETSNLNDFGSLMRIPIVLKANETYKFGEHSLEKEDKVTVCYHFKNCKMIKNLDKKSSMYLPEEFEAMTEWQAVLNFANALLGETKFSATDSVESIVKFMNDRQRDHHKKKYQENWIEPLFWRKTS